MSSSISGPIIETEIRIKNATLTFGTQTVFQDLSVAFPLGQWSCLLGPSGCGKSTLLRLLSNILDDSAKLTYTLEGPELKSNVSYLSQHNSLLPWLTALDNTGLSCRLAGKQHWKQRAKDMLAKVGLANTLHKKPHQLSGGMRQRVALARILLEEKPVLLMDEPFSALDAITKQQLQTLAAQLLKNKTVIWVTHDPMEALRLGDAVYVMQGKPASIAKPLHLRQDIPRDFNNPDISAHYERLMTALAGDAA